MAKTVSIPLIQSQREIEIEIGHDGSYFTIRQFDEDCEYESEIYLKDLNTLSDFIKQLTSVSKHINRRKK